MKNQYFGDINDYRKYGLLRVLADDGKLKIGICWMLTPDDDRKDGIFRQYLAPDQSNQWIKYDQVLYKSLQEAVHDNRTRNVQQAESPTIIPSAQFYSRSLSDKKDERQTYFRAMTNQFAGVDLIFFDPDNGLEVVSTPPGHQTSSKYLYWDEVETIFQEGHSLLIYQHFVRQERNAFIAQKAAKLREHTTSATEIIAFRTAHVVFFLVVQPQHAAYIRQQTQKVKEIWKDQICVDPC